MLPAVGAALQAAGVELVADERCIPHLPAGSASPAAEKDWRTEFLCLKMAVKAVGSLDEAVAHVNEHGSHHTDCIVTEDEAAAKEFMARVDSAGRCCVCVWGGTLHGSPALRSASVSRGVSQRINALCGRLSIRVWRRGGCFHQPHPRAGSGGA